MITRPIVETIKATPIQAKNSQGSLLYFLSSQRPKRAATTIGIPINDELGGKIPPEKLDEAQRNNAINNKDAQNINTNELTAKIPALKKPKSEEAIKNIENIDQFLKRF